MTDAVVMAAGQGTRLRPLTERWPKPVLPIDGRPVIATLLREIAGAGAARVFVVTGHLAQQVEELVGDGRAFGLEVVYVRQPAVLGSADAVGRAIAAGARAPFLVSAADTVYTPGDLARVVEQSSGCAGALAVRRVPPPDVPHRQPVRIADGRVLRVKDDDRSNPLSAAPLWMWGRELLPYLDGLTGPPFELGSACQRAIDDGLAIGAVEIGKTRDLTRPVDLVVENFPYLA